MAKMNKKGIPGIPYFGEKTADIYKKILEADVKEERKYSSLYELVQKEKSSTKLIVIDNKWLTYFRDIKFNYRDKKVFTPFYVYDVAEINEPYLKQYKGHLLCLNNGKSIGIRYNYQLNEYDLNLLNNKLTLYDMKLEEKYVVSFEKYYDGETFDIAYLYERYIDYCKNYEDNLILKHTEGYTVISRAIDGVKNYEQVIRNEKELNDYIETDVNLYYRDVRNLSNEDFNVKIGFDMCNKSYWERVLDFESLLYCIMASGAVPDDLEFRKEWQALGRYKHFIKYGNRGIKLIFKDYWLPEVKVAERKSWSRV